MIQNRLVLRACQLAGEASARLLGLAVPGPVMGMVLMLGLLAALPGFAAHVRSTAEGILANLSLLFVPAGVGVVGHVPTRGTGALALLAAVIASTLLAIAAGAAAFVLVARLTGVGDD